MDEKMTLLNNLADLLVATDSRREMKILLRGLLTQKELEEIPMRLEIVKQLIKQTPHQQIAKNLGVGVSTVTRGSKEVQKGHFQYLSWRPEHRAGRSFDK